MKKVASCCQWCGDSYLSSKPLTGDKWNMKMKILTRNQSKGHEINWNLVGRAGVWSI